MSVVCAQWVRNVSIDDYITFKISGSGGCVLCMCVTAVKRYASFDALLCAEGFGRLLPGRDTDIPVSHTTTHNNYVRKRTRCACA